MRNDHAIFGAVMGRFSARIQNPRARRLLLLVVYSFLLVMTLASTAVISGLLLLSQKTVGDRLAEVSDVIAGGTAVLAVIAGLIAIQAYAAATGLPRLELQVLFSGSEKNKPIFRAGVAAEGILEMAPLPGKANAIISLRNRSKYAARSVVVTVEISSIAVRPDAEFSPSDEWVAFSLPDSRSMKSDLMIQWDSGADGMVHGGASRRLPDLNLGSLRHHPDWPSAEFRIQVLADGGYRRKIVLPILFVKDGDCSPEEARTSKVSDWI